MIGYLRPYPGGTQHQETTMTRTPMPRPINSLSDRLALHAEQRSGVHALTELGPEGTPTATLDYGTLWRRVNGLASRLLAAGDKGSPVLIPEHNRIDYVVAYLACIRAGAIAVTAHAPRANDRSGRLAAIIRDSQPVRALASESTIKHCRENGDSLLQAQRFFATDDPELDRTQEHDIPEVASESIAMFQYTSGSTSQPRAVQVTHGNLIANLDVMGTLFIREDSSATVCWLPLFHDMGLIGLVMTSLMNGITTHLMTPQEFVMRPIRWLQAISRTGAEHSCAPNFAYGICVDRTTEEDRSSLDLSAWKVALNGAETIHPRTIERFIEAFEPSGFQASSMQPCYGLAESTLVVASRVPGTRLGIECISAEALAKNRVVRCDHNTEDAMRITTCGPVVPGHDLRILDPSGALTNRDGMIGELCIRGPSVTKGYHRGGAAELDTFVSTLDGKPGPWLRTGDLGGLLDGELVVAGRLKDLIIVGGSNHHPQDLEQTAEEAHPDIATGGCAAFAVSGEASHEGEQVVLVVELTRERMRAIRKNPTQLESLTNQLARQVRSAISSEHSVAVHRCVILQSGGIPRTTSGKVQRRSASEAWRRDELPILKGS